MAIINQGNWCQASVSTGAVGIRTAVSILRREGYTVRVMPMGRQVTNLGSMKMTMIDIRPGNNQDTSAVAAMLKWHIPELKA